MSRKHRSRSGAWSRRPVFRKHQRLTPKRLNRIHDYHATRLRHALLGLAGPGVVYGYAVGTGTERKSKCKKSRIHVDCGLAIDHCGRMLHWPGGRISMGELAGLAPEEAGWYTLSAHYSERRVRSDRRCYRRGGDWIREGVAFSLEPGCREVPWSCPEHRRRCVSPTDYVCGRLGADDVAVPPYKDLKALCADCGELCAVGHDDWLYDPEGLPLACVEIYRPEPGRQDAEPALGFAPSEPKICAHRPYVYRNPLLYELIRGCNVDLARVESLSWQDWVVNWGGEVGWDHQVPRADFNKRFKSKEGFTIRFTRPIRTATLHPASIFLRAVVQERRGDYWEGRRIPCEPKVLDERDGYARAVRLEFEKDWLRAEVHGKRSTLDFGARIELVVRGSLLRDECGCMLDARPLGFDPEKPGQTMPGDDFVAVFRLAAN